MNGNTERRPVARTPFLPVHQAPTPPPGKSEGGPEAGFLQYFTVNEAPKVRVWPGKRTIRFELLLIAG